MYQLGYVTPQLEWAFWEDMNLATFDNEHVQSSHPSDATNSKHQGCHTAAMWAVATVTVASSL